MATVWITFISVRSAHNHCSTTFPSNVVNVDKASICLPLYEPNLMCVAVFVCMSICLSISPSVCLSLVIRYKMRSVCHCISNRWQLTRESLIHCNCDSERIGRRMSALLVHLFMFAVKTLTISHIIFVLHNSYTKWIIKREESNQNWKHISESTIKF